MGRGLIWSDVVVVVAVAAAVVVIVTLSGSKRDFGPYSSLKSTAYNTAVTTTIRRPFDCLSHSTT